MVQAMVVVALGAMCVGAAGQPHEEGGDPYRAPGERAKSVPAVVARPWDGHFIAQVNVDGNGMNIVGDAANEPSLAIDPTAPNRMVIGWRQFDTISSNFRQAGYAWSNDGGRTWHFPGVLTPGQFRSDPVLESDSSGNFYYYSLPSSSGGWRCEVFKSEDGGKTWGPPVLANGGDRAWFTVDKGGKASDGHLYAIWNPQYGCCGSGSFGRDVSGGVMPWPNASPGTPIWGTIAVGPDAEVYVGGRSGTSLRITRSDDAKNPSLIPSFSPQVTVGIGGSLVTFGATPNPGGASGQTWIDVNRSSGPNRGHVYVATLVDPPGGDPADVFFARSTDGGLTWSNPVRVNDDPQTGGNWQWFVSMSVAPGGRIDVTYNSTHGTGSTALSAFYYTYSEDEGATWSPPEALTPVWNSTVGWPNQNKIGDYYDQESDDVGVSIAMSATMNGEQDVYFIRVNDWDCNRNGVGDEEDLLAGTLSDCDGNGIPDECEIAAGAKADLNGNGVPDECECYADCDGSGALDLFDYLCFVNAFNQGIPQADCDINGVLDLFDFLCFVNAFNAGCP